MSVLPAFIPGLDSSDHVTAQVRVAYGHVQREPEALEVRLARMGFTTLQIEACLNEPADFAKKGRAN